MTAFKSQYWADTHINMLRGVSPTLPTAQLNIALITTAPTDRTGTSMVEVTGGSYARQALTFANMPASATISGTGLTVIRGTVNNAQLNFTSMPACTVVGVAVYDDAVTPNFLYYMDLTGGSLAVSAGANFQFPTNNLTFEEI